MNQQALVYKWSECGLIMTYDSVEDQIYFSNLLEETEAFFTNKLDERFHIIAFAATRRIGRDLKCKTINWNKVKTIYDANLNYLNQLTKNCINYIDAECDYTVFVCEQYVERRKLESRIKQRIDSLRIQLNERPKRKAY